MSYRLVVLATVAGVDIVLDPVGGASRSSTERAL